MIFPSTYIFILLLLIYVCDSFCVHLHPLAFDTLSQQTKEEKQQSNTQVATVNSHATIIII